MRYCALNIIKYAIKQKVFKNWNFILKFGTYRLRCDQEQPEHVQMKTQLIAAANNK